MQVRNGQAYVFDDFRLCEGERLLLRRGEAVPLHGKAFDLLLVLIRHRGKLLTKDELFEMVWPDQSVEESNLTVNMSAVRKALGERASAPRYITTISGRGYRFTGEVREVADEGDGPTPEDKTLMRSEEAETSRPAPAQLPASTPESIPSPPAREKNRRPSTRVIAAALGSLLVSAAALTAAYQFLKSRKENAPFERVKLVRLTNSGKVAGVAISPDGKYVADVQAEGEGNSLWVQQVGTGSRVRVLPPTPSQFWGLTFSPDGEYLYYNLFAGDKTDVELFRVPSLGGVAQRIPGIVASSITFAPDGKRFAYTTPIDPAGEISLLAADADGTNQRVLAKPRPQTRFELSGQACSWSPDGKLIACLLENFAANESYSTIVGVGVEDGAQHILSAEKWHNVKSVQWLRDGSGLLIVAGPTPAARTQIWFLPYPAGAARQITNDLGSYAWLGVTSDAKTIVTAQHDTHSSLSVGAAGEDAQNFRELAREVGPLHPLTWTPDGKIVYRSTADGAANLWIMDADGGGRRQLTVGAEVDSWGLCVSPDGNHIVFVSWRDGKSNLWRVGAAGGDLTRLTKGEAESHPYCAPDGRRVVFQKGIGTLTLWEIPLAGGEPVRLTDYRSKWPSLSRDGERVAYFYPDESKWRIGIISSRGGPPLRSVELPAGMKSYVVHWSADGRALFYNNTIGDVGNVWSLPLDGGRPQPVTNFAALKLEDFAWSPDGKRLAVARSAEIRDAVLIRDLRP